MYTIQKNVPLPAVNFSARRTRRKYQFESMEVGDMFFVPNKTTGALGGHVSKEAKRLQRTFALRQTTMKEVRGGWTACSAQDLGATVGVGVWRTK